MELDKFHVRYPATGAPGHRYSVAARGVRVRGVAVDLTGASGGKDGVRSCNRHHSSARTVEHVNPVAARAFPPTETLRGDQVDRQMILEHGNIRVGSNALLERCLDGVAGRICRVDDTSVTVTAFLGQVHARWMRLVLREAHSHGGQPFDRGAALADDIAHRGLLAQSATRR